jgi:RNA polymerase sigma-70 factor (ECF subfamily)
MGQRISPAERIVFNVECTPVNQPQVEQPEEEFRGGKHSPGKIRPQPGGEIVSITLGNNRCARILETAGCVVRAERMKNDLTSTNGLPAEDVPAGRFEARYLAFIETVKQLRPSLHRYCARMVGSVLDGEDIVQEVLFQAYRKLDAFDPARPLAPWLFRIAYNRSIDFLRRRGTREKVEAQSAIGESDFTPPVDPVGPALGQAVEHLVLVLPPKERACVLLKDVFDHTLEEIAELVDSTVGGVKAALHRGRSKLAERPIGVPVASARTAEDAALLRLYVERFNQRDWAGARELIAADARLLVVDRFAGLLADSPYFGTYERMPEPWRLAVGEVDGETVIVIQHPGAGGWLPRAAVRLRIADGRIADVRDYALCPWMLPAATSLRIEAAS